MPLATTEVQVQVQVKNIQFSWNFLFIKPKNLKGVLLLLYDVHPLFNFRHAKATYSLNNHEGAHSSHTWNQFLLFNLYEIYFRVYVQT